VHQGCCINTLFLNEAATRLSTLLSTYLVPRFSDSLHGCLIECWIVVDVGS